LTPLTLYVCILFAEGTETLLSKAKRPHAIRQRKLHVRCVE